jgi:hypothetical protein
MNVNVDKIEEDELPTLFGLWQLIPTQDPVEKIAPDNWFLKKTIEGFNMAVIPLMYLFYGNKENHLHLYNWIHKLYLAFIILFIPMILFLVYKFQKVEFTKSTMMIGVWVSMFAPLVILYGTSQNIAK